MRILYSLFALVAAASGISAAPSNNPIYQFPFTSISVQQSVNAGTQNNGAGQLVPSFTAYGQQSLRYSYELQYSGGTSDFTVTIGQAATALNQGSGCSAGAGSTQTTLLQVPTCGSIAYRTCTGFLNNPQAAAGYSVCSYARYTAAQPNAGGVISFQVPAVIGTQVVEVQTFNYLLNSVASQVQPVSYILSISVIDYTATGLGGLSGVQMWSLDSNYGTNIRPPFSTANSAYTLSFYTQLATIPSGAPSTKSITVSGVSQTVAISYMPYYIVTQSSVDTVFVQECTGLPCTACSIDTTPKLVLAGSIPINAAATPAAPFGTVPSVQKDAAANFPTFSSTQASNIFTKHGRYYFPFVPQNTVNNVNGNCVRFINRAQGVVNDNTITIDVAGYICGLYTTCNSCVDAAPTSTHATTGCGWCLSDNYNANTVGTCLIGHQSSTLIAGTSYFSYDYSASTVVNNGQNVVCNRQSGINLPAGGPGRFVSYYTDCVVLIRGDPRISGLQGQDFQVHGTPNEYFNLVSTPSLQVNSRFVYLDDAACDNFTTCFSHPGTYIDEIGVMMGENKIRVAAGSIKESARVFVNGKEIKVSAHKHTAGSVSVTFANARRVVVKTPEFMMTISQSDKFFNVDSALLKTELLDQGSKLAKLTSSRATEANKVMHGLIGQTWRNNVYAGEREYEGEVSDYQVADGIWGKDFAFNLYL